MHCVRIKNLNDSIGIRLMNAMHLGKKFPAAIFSVIIYFNSIPIKHSWGYEILKFGELFLASCNIYHGTLIDNGMLRTADLLLLL